MLTNSSTTKFRSLLHTSSRRRDREAYLRKFKILLKPLNRGCLLALADVYSYETTNLIKSSKDLFITLL